MPFLAQKSQNETQSLVLSGCKHPILRNAHNSTSIQLFRPMSQDVLCGSPKYRYVFTTQEDQLLENAVQQFGTKDWDIIARQLPGRTSRQCRERWLTYLSPDVNRTPWSSEEDGLLFDVVRTHGPKWGTLVGFFCNRTQNNIKNRWNTIVRKAKALGLEVSDRKNFLEAGHKIASRSTRTHFEYGREVQDLDPEEFYSIGNLLNSKVSIN
jgi:hypothetical protein